MLDPKRNMIAATPFCFPPYHPFAAYSLFPKVGIQNVEIPALSFEMSATYGLVSIPPETLRKNIKLVKKVLEQHQLNPITVAVFSDLLHSDQVDTLRLCIDLAQQLGSQYVLTDATTEENLDSDQWRKLVNTMRHVADYAEDRNVCIILEIHAGATRTGERSVKLIEAVDHPNVGINYDTGNVYYFNEDVDPAEDIKHIAEHVKAVHLKDTVGGMGEWQFCALGEGRVNFPEIIKVLQSFDFRGPYCLEVEGKEGEDLNRQGYLERIEKSLNYLRQIGVMPPSEENS